MTRAARIRCIRGDRTSYRIRPTAAEDAARRENRVEGDKISVVVEAEADREIGHVGIPSE